MPFTCSICAEESARICARCTKDSCNNHLCEKCLRCSDCCECEVTLSDVGRGVSAGSARSFVRAASAPKPVFGRPQEPDDRYGTDAFPDSLEDQDPEPETETEIEIDMDLASDADTFPGFTAAEPPHPPPDPDPAPGDEPGQTTTSDGDVEPAGSN